MSAGSQALERSALEAKDRDSLIQIATAMGGKPGSRAKKADIIDLVLELAGVGTADGADQSDPAQRDEHDDRDGSSGRGDASDQDRSSGPAGDDGSERAGEHDEAQRVPSTSTRRRPSATPNRGADTRRSDARPGRADTAGADDDAGADRQDRSDARPDRSGRSRDDHRNDDPSRSAESGQGGSGSDESGQGESGQGESGQGESGQGESGQGGQANGSGQREDGEPGNRRRRRRGRDRNREGAPQAGAAPSGEEQWQGEPVEVAGLLDLRDEGYGFLRVSGYLPSRDDVYVSVKQVRQFGLRKGDHLSGASRPAARNEKNPALLRIDEINGGDPESNRDRRTFDDLTACHPGAQLRLAPSTGSAEVVARIIDLIAPIGRGQRGLIVSPPRLAKTTVLKEIAVGLEATNPDVHLMVLLIDERPEEVTDLARSLQSEVIASTFDRPADEHVMVAELALERAKRLVEEGKDVVIVADGLTRLARAANQAGPEAGRTLAGGIDAGALVGPKRFFAAARNTDEGGSLTILATILTDTGSTMDDVIFEELAGTANMELHLDRHLAEQRVHPPIDVHASSTDHEELVFDEAELAGAQQLRREITAAGHDHPAGAALELLVQRVRSFPTNAALLAETAKA